MPNPNSTPNVNTEQLSEVVNNNQGENLNLSLETLILLINTERLKHLQDSTNKEFSELKVRQDKVSFLQKLIKKINVKTSDKGELDVSSDNELKEMLKQAKEMGVDIKKDPSKFSKDEKERLVDNIRITVDDYNVKNDMQLQTINRYTNERYESYQLARSIIKPLHDAKTKLAQNLK